MAKTYSDLLKDPRWQKKRLEILQRDSFACQVCFSTENTLHVHHKIYHKGHLPWEYEDQELITLCAECHELEGKELERSLKALCDAVRVKFLSWQIDQISKGFVAHEKYFTSDVSACAIGHSLATNSEGMVNDYFNYLSEKRKEHEQK